jgi:muramoyltetrapeptide carboxypeptidase
MLRGKRLKKGDTIGIVAPANYTTEDKIERAVKNIESKGYKVKVGKGCREKWFTFAGKDEVRAKDIMDFFKDDEINAILCLRGGFGSIRLLEYLDFDEIKKNPKIFIGFSDITTLHSAFQKKSNLITFHGPMAASNFSDEILDEISWNGLFTFLENIENEMEIKNPQNEPLKKLVGGRGIGRSIGGNLVTFVSNMGTDYDVEYEDTILFIEEIGEPAYKIDRALTQLINSKGFRGIKGIILGDFNDCGGENENAYSLMELFEERLKKLGIPVIYNFKSGHCWPMMTLPMGAKIAIDADEGSIKILEEVVKGEN